MSFDWEHYIALAKKLASKTSEGDADESCLRSAISRAYYSAYHAARVYVRTKLGRQIPKQGDAHTFVWDTLCESGVREEFSAGTHGRKLRRKRNIADYERVSDLKFKHEAAAAIDTAEAIRQLVA